MQQKGASLGGPISKPRHPGRHREDSRIFPRLLRGRTRFFRCSPFFFYSFAPSGARRPRRVLPLIQKMIRIPQSQFFFGEREYQETQGQM